MEVALDLRQLGGKGIRRGEASCSAIRYTRAPLAL